jgi:23S rRNA pseudouridine1911/1915/1917 synthase
MLDVLFEDYYLLAVNKEAGLSAESGAARHPSAENQALMYFTEELNKNSTSKRLKATPFLRVAHRLDRAASGVLVMAKTKSALTNLMQQFENRAAQKTYYALVSKPMPQKEGTLKNWLKKDADGVKALIFNKDGKGHQICELHYRMVEQRGKDYLLEIKPVTGRFHQIRAQLAHAGAPIVGDSPYGGRPGEPYQIKLHAASLRFQHPKTGEWTEITAPMPW